MDPNKVVLFPPIMLVDLVAVALFPVQLAELPVVFWFKVGTSAD